LSRNTKAIFLLAEFLFHSLHLCDELIYDFKHYVPDQQKLKHWKLVKVEIENIRKLKKTRNKAYNSEPYKVGKLSNSFYLRRPMGYPIPKRKIPLEIVLEGNSKYVLYAMLVAVL